MDDNIVRLPPRPVATGADLRSALMLAEMNRKLCLEAAAGYVEILQGALASNPAHIITSDAMVALLAEIASSIRLLKQDGDLPMPPRSAA